MNIQKLKYRICLVPCINDITQGKEFLFTQKVKSILPKTKFELLGEQLVVGKDNSIGKCDLWLANIPNNFLLSLELKVGNPMDLVKCNSLKKQVYKYTDFMKIYYPEYVIYGLGAYKYKSKDLVTQQTNNKGIKFIDYLPEEVTDETFTEVRDLKARMMAECI